jgi:hypothetical protein
MSAINSQPTNTNFLQPTKFVLAFPRLTNTQFFCQKVNLPGVSLDEIEQPTPFIEIHRPGDKMYHETLNVSFIVDEDLRTWLEIYKWMKGITFPEEFEQYKELNRLAPVSMNSKYPQFCDAQLNILTALNNVNIVASFKDVFPIKLSSIEFDSTITDTPVIVAECTFRFTSYTVEKV